MEIIIQTFSLIICFNIVVQSQTQLIIPDKLSGTKFNLTIQNGSINYAR